MQAAKVGKAPEETAKEAHRNCENAGIVVTFLKE
jgi:hypothetical protein